MRLGPGKPPRKVCYKQRATPDSFIPFEDKNPSRCRYRIDR